MPGCITQDYKNILVGLIDQETAKEIISAVVTVIPLCEQVLPTAAAVKEAKARKGAEPWGIKPLYIDEKGNEHEYSSPTAFLRDKGIKVSGIQCDEEGKSCKALSLVEIMRIHGYTVTGNGEPKKAAEGGSKMTIWHPKAPKKE